jgi:Na+-driven multidrug efflux pump
VRQSFYSAVRIALATMFLLTAIAQLAGDSLIRAFSTDSGVIAFGGDYLRIISLNFIAVGIVFTSSSVFQGIGNTVPPLATSMTRLALFALPATLLSRMPGFQIKHVWYLSVASVILQACANVLLLRREFRSRLAFPEVEPTGSLQQA